MELNGTFQISPWLLSGNSGGRFYDQYLDVNIDLSTSLLCQNVSLLNSDGLVRWSKGLFQLFIGEQEISNQ